MVRESYDRVGSLQSEGRPYRCPETEVTREDFKATPLDAGSAAQANKRHNLLR